MTKILDINGRMTAGKINMTNGDLIRMHYEMDNWKQNKSTLFYFNRAKINEFYNKNGILIQSFSEKQRAINNEHFEYDENGVRKMEGEGKDAKPVYLEGKTPESFAEAMKEIVSQVVAVSL